MFIGKAAQLSATTVKTIRHYESIGLLPPAQRQGNYRLYDQQSVDLLIFIKCAQQLGFKLKELQGLLARHSGPDFPWELAREALAGKKRELAQQIASLQQLHARIDDFEVQLETARHQCPLGPL